MWGRPFEQTRRSDVGLTKEKRKCGESEPTEYELEEVPNLNMLKLQRNMGVIGSKHVKTKTRMRRRETLGERLTEDVQITEKDL